MLQWRRRIKEVQGKAALIFFGVRGSTEDAQPGDVDEHGNLIVTVRDENDKPINGVTPDMDGQSPDGVDVTAADEVIILANENRIALIMTNDSDTTIYLGIGEATAVNSGPRLNANGGSLTLSKYGPIFTTGPIHGVHSSGGNTKRLSFQEFH